MVHVRVLLRSAWLPVLQVVLRVLEVVGSSRVTPTDRAFLEVALQDVTSTKSVLAKMAGIRPLARVYETLVLD